MCDAPPLSEVVRHWIPILRGPGTYPIKPLPPDATAVRTSQGRKNLIAGERAPSVWWIYIAVAVGVLVSLNVLLVVALAVRARSDEDQSDDVFI